MPKVIQFVSQANPFYILTEGFRQPLIYHAIPWDLITGLLYVAVLSLFLFCFGLNRFRKIKGYFSSVM
jgi:lipopolysaccharide transport system permease protein